MGWNIFLVRQGKESLNNNIAVLTVAFNEPRLIGPCVRQFKSPYIEEPLFHLVLVSKSPWRGHYPKDYITGRRALDNRADSVIEGEWKNQAEQFNFGLSHLREMGYKWAIICDADEYYTPLGINVIIDTLNKAEKLKIFCAPFMNVYWKTPEYQISNPQHDNPVVAIRTDEIFSDKRTPTLSEYSSVISYLHHFSYVRSDLEMLKKIKSFEHSHEFDLEKWYNEVWLNWKPEDTNLHPVVPTQFEQAIPISAPTQILKNFYA
jgi:hypothetical protein